MGHIVDLHDIRCGGRYAMDAVFYYYEHREEILSCGGIRRRMDTDAAHVGLRSVYFTGFVDVGKSGKMVVFRYSAVLMYI